MKNSSKRLLSSIIALVLVVSALVIFFSFVQPIYFEIQTTRGEEAGRQALAENQQRVIQQVQNIMSSYEQSGDLQETASKVLPYTIDVAGALGQLNGLATLNGLVAQSFSVSAPTLQNVGKKGSALTKPIGTVIFQGRLVGPYEGFKGYLKNLEDNVRLFDVKSITVQPVNKPEQNLYTIDLTVVAYYQSQ